MSAESHTDPGCELETLVRCNQTTLLGKSVYDAQVDSVNLQ